MTTATLDALKNLAEKLEPRKPKITALGHKIREYQEKRIEKKPPVTSKDIQPCYSMSPKFERYKKQVEELKAFLECGLDDILFRAIDRLHTDTLN